MTIVRFREITMEREDNLGQEIRKGGILRKLCIGKGSVGANPRGGTFKAAFRYVKNWKEEPGVCRA